MPETRTHSGPSIFSFFSSTGKGVLRLSVKKNVTPKRGILIYSVIQ